MEFAELVIVFAVTITLSNIASRILPMIPAPPVSYTHLDALANGEKVQLIGFGNFEVRERAARKGRNPQTGEEIEIPASKVPAFKPGKALKDAVK